MKTSPLLSCTGSQETLFFSTVEGKLRQWIELTLASGFTTPQTAEASLRAGGETVTTQFLLQPGAATYRVYAPLLWPERQPEEAAPLTITAAGQTVETACPVGHHRPWTVYVLADVCTDATWVYADYASARKDDADLTAAELSLAEATRGGLPDNHNRYNLVHALNLEYFEEFYPERLDQLAEAIRFEEITLNPFYNMTLTLNISLEEQIRLFYKAREWALRSGSEIRYANHQETPSIAWDMAGILAGCGVKHLVKGILPYECPWAARLSEPPIFLWEGPDGSRLKMRRYNHGYVEGGFLLQDLAAATQSLHHHTIPEYEAWGERYPFTAIGLVGVYGDLIPAEAGKLQSRDLSVLKASTISRYNSQDWEYPRLVNASHGQFWREIDRQIADRGIRLEVARGDYGVGWDVWPACLAYDVAGWRRAQERAATADTLAAILSQLDPDWHASQASMLKTGWKNLMMLADHAWNGANDANRLLNASLRRTWQVAANEAFDSVISSALQALAAEVQPAETNRLLVFNRLGWNRDALVRLPAGFEGQPVGQEGSPLPTQRDPLTGEICALAKNIPSVGYRCIDISDGTPPTTLSPFHFEPNALEGPYYRLEISPQSGGISSLVAKSTGRELVDPESHLHLNQALFFSSTEDLSGTASPLTAPPRAGAGEESTPTSATVTHLADGPLFASLRVTTTFAHISLETTYTLYTHLDRVDITNKLTKPPSSERHQLDFVFPFQMPRRRIHLEQPGAILDPERECLPGAGLSAAVVRQFIDLSNEDFGVTLSMTDSFTVQFGGRTTTQDVEKLPPSATIYALALGNIYDSNEAIRDQAGQEHFTFRFSLRGYAGAFDPAAAVRFAWENNNPLEVIPLPGTGKLLSPSAHSFLTVEPSTAILAGLKAAEEDGLILRLWETGNCDHGARVRLAIPGSPTRSVLTDHLEQDLTDLDAGEGVDVPLRARGVSTARFIW